MLVTICIGGKQTLIQYPPYLGGKQHGCTCNLSACWTLLLHVYASVTVLCCEIHGLPVTLIARITAKYNAGVYGAAGRTPVNPSSVALAKTVHFGLGGTESRQLELVSARHPGAYVEDSPLLPRTLRCGFPAASSASHCYLCLCCVAQCCWITTALSC